MASAASRGGHIRLLLGAYLLGGLSASQEAAVQAHLNRCAKCRAEHDYLARVRSWLDLLEPEDIAGALRVACDHEPDAEAVHSGDSTVTLADST